MTAPDPDAPSETPAAGRDSGAPSLPHQIARMPDRDVWLADFRDTEGNALALLSEVPHSAPV